MSFVKKAVEPPEVEEGDILEAKILGIEKVTSKWEDEEGNPREQLQFNLELANGYQCKAWIAYYDPPTTRSKMGKLGIKLEEAIGEKILSTQEFIERLKKYGRVFVTCSGFREFEDGLYPKFSIVASKLPKLETKTKEAQPKQALLDVDVIDVKAILSRFSEAIKMGLPLNEQDWNKSLLVGERIALLKQGYVEYKEGLYFFTQKAEALFR
jgi:hypothetical protein